MKISYYTIAFVIILFLLSSCLVKREKIVYLIKDEINQEMVSNDYQLRFKPDDLIQITVSSEDLEASMPFNLPVIAYNSGGVRALGNPQFQSYLVDSEGFIEYPILGRIKAAGLTRIELINRLKKRISPEYVKDPIINVILTNFKVTVQGDVRSPGTYILPNERYSILDALGLAGDLNISAKRENVKLIREENGKKMIYELDLRSKNLLTSPAYYLTQNDVIYVEPNRAKIQDSSYTRNTGLFISLASVLISLITVITR